MGFFQKFARLLSPQKNVAAPVYWVHARCSRCGEELHARVNLYHDLSIEYAGKQPTYHCRKVLIGENLCFQKLEVRLTFDHKRQMIDRQITGGTFIGAEEEA
ncbi:MAG: hypothetical protein JSV61_05975 [Anaerolineales bacterium]|nr:MAG: hypothetical protein JSV61_05975 [Anaerolineales bacterium]